MAGAQFEYDEKGTTFYYFLLSFFGLILLPLTYYLWIYIKPPEKEKHQKRQCYCAACLYKKDNIKKQEPNHRFLRTMCVLVLAVLWGLFAVGVYKVTQFEREFTEYDPYAVLELDVGATVQEIRKQYRRLSLKYHPDKEGGDSKLFMRIAKAYEALTDEESRKNWEEFGSPDGPSATTFGIALPSWLVSKENSLWVLGAYGLAFMVILPVAVGTWWYKSIQYSCDQILLDTTQIYYYFFHKTPSMHLRRVIMILAASMEFEKGHNHEVQERPSDNYELPELMRDLTNLGEKNKERPLCFPYSVKARALLHGHLTRLDLPPHTLKKDLELILSKCPYLIQEMVSVVAQLIAMAKAGRAANMPRLETLENVMRLCPMMVQGLWENKSPLLQLPHLTMDNLRHFKTKKRNIRTIRGFVSLKDDERRSLLRNLMDEQYDDVMNVCRTFPSVNMDVEAKVIDEEENHITAGAIVTVVVNLTRRDLEEFFGDEEEEELLAIIESNDPKTDGAQESPKAVSNKSWQKNKKKSKKGNKLQTKRKPVKQQPKKKPSQQDEKSKSAKEDKKDDENKENKDKESEENEIEEKDYEGDSEDNEEDSKENGDSGVFDETNKSSDESDDNKEDSKADDGTDGEGEDEWDKLQAHISKKEKIPEAKSRESHVVHCPYFPEEKHEMWWIYLCDRKKQVLITPPQQITGFKEQEEVELRFQAPEKIGTYMYSTCLRSDSYIDFDVNTNFKIHVHEAKEIVPEQWTFDTDEEETKDDQESGESEYTEEESDNDD